MLKFNKDFTKNYDKESVKGYILEEDVKYSNSLHDLHINLSFLPEIMKVSKYNNLLCNLCDQNNYVVHIETSIIKCNSIKESAQSNPV